MLTCFTFGNFFLHIKFDLRISVQFVCVTVIYLIITQKRRQEIYMSSEKVSILSI